jgi:VWFA-related protein
MHRTARASVLGALTLVWWGIAVAQPPSASQAPKPGERVPETVALDFYAATPDGNPVADLKAEDVQLRIDGRPRTLKWLEWVPVADAPSESTGAPLTPVPPPFASNAPGDAGRSFVIVIENDSFRPGRDRPLRAALDRFLAALSPRDRAALMTTPYGGFKVNLTNDYDRVRAELAKITGQVSSTETGSEMACRTRRTLESLVGLVSGFRALEGATNVLFVTSGMAGPRRDAALTLAPGMCELTVDMFAQVGAAAGAARATFYVIQPEDPMIRPGSALVENVAGAGFKGSDNPLEGIEHLAGVTGAQRLHLSATGENTLVRIARETSAYYVLGFEAQPGDRNGVSRQVDVRVGRAGVVVRARPNLTIAKPADRPALKGQAVTPRSMLREARTFRDLPLRAVGFVSSNNEDGRVKVVCLLEPTEPSVQLAAAAAGLFDENGRLVGQWTAEPGNLTTTPVTGALVASRPGRYRLRVAATDVAGRSGSADYEMVAELVPAGQLSVSSLVLGLSRTGVAFTPRMQFGAEPVALGYVEIYGRAASGLSVAAEVARSPEGPAIGPSVPGAIKAINGEDRFIATVAVPIGGLPPGDYVVRVSVAAAGQPAGRVMRTLRKVRL